jgi:hypothetical protein
MKRIHIVNTDSKPSVQEVNDRTNLEKLTTHRLCTHPVSSHNDDILIIDSAADISCVGQGFEILFYT